MIKRIVLVVERPRLLKLLIWKLKAVDDNLFPNSSLFLRLSHEGNEYYEFNNIPPQLAFTEEEEERGAELLTQMGIDRTAPFVCFHSRDSAYWETTNLRLKYYSSVSNYGFRDSDIRGYLPAVERLAAVGLYVLRMGAVVARPLPETSNRIIDYATRFRSDFGDVYLIAKCKFFLGTGSGITEVATTFNVPVAQVNSIPWPYRTIPPKKGDLFIPKKFWSVEEKRFLTFKEILELEASTPLGLAKKPAFYESKGLELISNTPEEILSLAGEINQQLDGAWKGTEEDEELQQRFRALFPPSHKCYGFPSRIGADFLRNHRKLLD